MAVPAPPEITVTDTRVEIGTAIQFRTGRADLLSSSHDILRGVAQVLADSPEMRLRIEGHTDNVGGEQTNLDLSRQRATSVRTFLMSTGVAGSRLTAEGFGETQPVDTNRTRDGRARNRRVSFVIE
jgi:outer membrane protein OmpA-like peptidoglycan-associated protein